MSLTQQFLITLTLPAALLALTLYAWREHRQGLYPRFWLLALLAATVWSTSIVSFYGGVALPQELAFVWRVFGRHVLTLLSILLLLSTAVSLSLSDRLLRLILLISLFFWAGAILLDPAIWAYELPSFRVGGQPVTHFTLWAAVWVVAWFIPLLSAWLLTRQQIIETPRSLHRNRLNYWLLTVSLFMVGSGLALVQQPEHPIWQEVGALILIVAAASGLITYRQSRLPELRLTLRRLMARLTTVLLVFGLTALLFWYLLGHLPQRSGVNTSLDLIYIAALFALVFMAINQVSQPLARWLFRDGLADDQVVLLTEPPLMNGMLHPEQFAEVILDLAQSNLAMETGWLFQAESGPDGSLLLQAVASLNHGLTFDHFMLEADSAFARELQNYPPRPLSLYDVERLARQETEPAPAFEQWPSEWLMPLPAGQQLAGVLALGDKVAGIPYTDQDFVWLQRFAAQIGPLLLQSQHLHHLQEVNRRLLQQVDSLQEETHRLRELNNLYDQFVELVSPRLRQTVVNLDSNWQQFREGEAGSGETIDEQLNQLRLIMDNLILIAHRVRQQHAFQLEEVYLDEVVRQVTTELSAMAQARRVTVEVDTSRSFPPVHGDKQRLIEAVRYLVHNAVKFNKIGGTVAVECGRAEDSAFITVRDTGVGIPPERLKNGAADLLVVQPDELQSRRPGLGLWLARFIVREHGGRLEIDSIYGGGSTFTIYLPLEGA